VHRSCTLQSAQLKANMSECRYTFKECKSKCLHVTSGGVESKYCTFHVTKISAQRKRQKIFSYTKSVEETERARLGMKLHREKKKQIIQEISNPEVQRIAKQMARLKKKGREFIVIKGVIETLDPEQIELTGVAEPIDFTDEKGPVLRTMQEIAEQSKPLFDNIINALRIVFPGCTQRRLKVIKSLANDTPQLTHTDFDVSLINKRVFSLDAYHYSVVIALQAETHLLTGTERKRIDIPINSMIMFRGDFPHAGGGYAVDNTRIFISVSSPFFPESDSVFFVN
jgi:hypothetical protein